MSLLIGAIFKMVRQGEQWMSFQFVNVDYVHPMSRASNGEKNNKALSGENGNFVNLVLNGLDGVGTLDSPTKTYLQPLRACAYTQKHAHIHTNVTFSSRLHRSTNRFHHALMSLMHIHIPLHLLCS